MAKMVEQPPLKRDNPDKVPNEWFNGEWWEITPAKDIAEPDPEKARRLLYQIGRYRNATPRTRVRDGKVYIQRKREQ